MQEDKVKAELLSNLKKEKAMMITKCRTSASGKDRAFRRSLLGVKLEWVFLVSIQYYYVCVHQEWIIFSETLLQTFIKSQTGATFKTICGISGHFHSCSSPLDRKKRILLLSSCSPVRVHTGFLQMNRDLNRNFFKALRTPHPLSALSAPQELAKIIVLRMPFWRTF